MAWNSTIITLFPEMFPGPLGYALAGKALEEKIWSLQTVDLRPFGIGKYQGVDDTCYGGGAGMVLRPDVIDNALTQALETHPAPNPTVIYLTPRGTPFTQKTAHQLSDNPDGCILLCGRYEGIDDRVITHWREIHALQEISIGDYILSGGEMGALTLLDACIRLLPNVVNTPESLTSESFEVDLLEFPQYTRPKVWNNFCVPEILLSGHHAQIEKWRLEQSQRITQERRPDLWSVYLEKCHKEKK